MQYRNRATGRVVTRTQPDPWLEASKRWEHVEPLNRTPLPDRAPDTPEPDAEPENDDNDGAESPEGRE